MKEFDLMVIGAGSGLEIVAEGVDRGLRVAVVESGPFGGTCLNRGCIPSKMLIHCADVMETIRRADLFGIKAKVEGVDWQFIIRRAFEEIDAEAAGIEAANRKAPTVGVFKGAGRFVDMKTLEVNGERIRAETVVIAAGSRPVIPEIPGLSGVPHLTSDEALRLPELPGSMTIVGGGYIAAELAHFFGSLGTKVTIVYRGPQLMRTEDEQVARRFTEVYRRKFNVLLNAQISKVYRQGAGIALEVSLGGHAETVVSDTLLLATGRVPNTDRLEVVRTGVELDERGFVKVDGFLETRAPGIWALGDIVGKYLLKHSANLEAAYVANNIFNKEHKAQVDYRAMPHAAFSSPQVASVGLTEQEAKRQKVAYVAASCEYSKTAYGASIEDRDGFVKVLANPSTREILGCHIIGTDASILIQEAVNAMRNGLTADSFGRSIYVHPALPEVVQRAFGMLHFH
ncbi:MAG: FAD-dependent oxidoreductase [Dehalococcoidia bacterium]|nr:FAD-dependent oxidoreductase [Dehalococcoidia bacterium]